MLSSARIIETATCLADRDGFDAVTLRRVASELGVHVTSLYNHVPTRDAVIDGMVESLIREAQLPLSAVSWEEWVRSFFAGIGRIATTHPGAFQALHRRPVQGEEASASFELALGAFTRAGFSPGDAYNAVKATSLTALMVGMEKGMAVQGLVPETAIGELSERKFPNLRSVPELADPESAWLFSLETLVAGLRSQLSRRRADERETPRP